MMLCVIVVAFALSLVAASRHMAQTAPATSDERLRRRIGWEQEGLRRKVESCADSLVCHAAPTCDHRR